MKIRSAVLALSLVLVALPTAATAGEDFKPFIDCVVATRDCSAGKGELIKAGVIDMVVLKAARGGQDGFYVYAPEDAYFHAFPPAPAAGPSALPPPPPSLWNLYGFVTKLMAKPVQKPNPYVHYKLEAGVHEPVYLTFKRQESGELQLESGTTTLLPGGTVYLPGGGGECHADPESRALLFQEALARVKSVSETYMSAPEPEQGDVAREINITGHDEHKFYSAETCRKGLEVCAAADELRSVATPELQKFKK